MAGIEPNLAALLWFAPLWAVCCLGFLHVAGLYPIGRRVGVETPLPLVLANTLLWLALLAGLIAFAGLELRWTTAVVTAGLLFLFLPGVFQALPGRWRDGRAGMVAAGCMMAGALGLLAYAAADPIRSFLT